MRNMLRREHKPPRRHHKNSKMPSYEVLTEIHAQRLLKLMKITDAHRKELVEFEALMRRRSGGEEEESGRERSPKKRSVTQQFEAPVTNPNNLCPTYTSKIVTPNLNTTNVATSSTTRGLPRDGLFFGNESSYPSSCAPNKKMKTTRTTKTKNKFSDRSHHEQNDNPRTWAGTSSIGRIYPSSSCPRPPAASYHITATTSCTTSSAKVATSTTSRVSPSSFNKRIEPTSERRGKNCNRRISGEGSCFPILKRSLSLVSLSSISEISNDWDKQECFAGEFLEDEEESDLTRCRY